MTTKIQKQSGAQGTPVYLSIVKLEEVIDLVSNRNYGEFAASLFTNRGYSMADALLAISALKFLKLIDDSGTPTSLMGKIGQRGDAQKKAFEEVVRDAYEKLFSVTNAPHELPSDELFNEMRNQYGISSRIARQAVPAFLKLCEYAGLKEKGSITAKKHINKGKEGQTKSVLKMNHKKSELTSQAIPSDTFAIPVGKVFLSIPEDIHQKALFDEKVGKGLRDVLKEVKNFSDTYIEKETENSGSKQ